MSVSFMGLHEAMATFKGEGISIAEVVKVSGSGMVAPCAENDAFAGVACSKNGNYIGVQLRGYCKIKSADTSITPGFIKLCADGEGGVKKSDMGRELLVLDTEQDGDGLFIGVLL